MSFRSTQTGKWFLRENKKNLTVISVIQLLIFLDCLNLFDVLSDSKTQRLAQTD